MLSRPSLVLLTVLVLSQSGNCAPLFHHEEERHNTLRADRRSLDLIGPVQEMARFNRKSLIQTNFGTRPSQHPERQPSNRLLSLVHSRSQVRAHGKITEGRSASITDPVVPPAPHKGNIISRLVKRISMSFARFKKAAKASQHQIRVLASIGGAVLIVFLFFFVAIHLQRAVVVAALRSSDRPRLIKRDSAEDADDEEVYEWIADGTRTMRPNEAAVGA